MSADQSASAELRIKAVPGASRDAIAGMLGDRVKVRVSAPPEGGKANKAICALIAARLGVRPGQVEVIAGHSHPEKTLRIMGIDDEGLRARLGIGPA